MNGDNERENNLIVKTSREKQLEKFTDSETDKQHTKKKPSQT